MAQAYGFYPLLFFFWFCFSFPLLSVRRRGMEGRVKDEWVGERGEYVLNLTVRPSSENKDRIDDGQVVVPTCEEMRRR